MTAFFIIWVGIGFLSMYTRFRNIQNGGGH